MSTRRWRCLVLTAYLFTTLALAAQQGDAPNRAPKLVQQPCDPPVTTVTFGETSDPKVADRIKVLFDEDQARESSAKKGKDWGTIQAEDRVRQLEVMRYLEKGEINSADELYYAAMIFQHGNCVEHYKLANQLAERAMARGSNPAKWLYAATLDRYLMNQGMPQKFGTQFLRAGPDGKWQLYPVDPATTDDERARYNVPSLAAQKEKAEKLNMGSQ